MFKKLYRVKAHIFDLEGKKSVVTVEFGTFLDLRKDKYRKVIEDGIKENAYKLNNITAKYVDIESVVRIA